MRHQRKKVKPAKTVRVRCADGMVMPLPRGIVIGAKPQVFTPETVVEMKMNAFVMRRIAAGDFVVVDARKAKK